MTHGHHLHGRDVELATRKVFISLGESDGERIGGHKQIRVLTGWLIFCVAVLWHLRRRISGVLTVPGRNLIVCGHDRKDSPVSIGGRRLKKRACSESEGEHLC